MSKSLLRKICRDVVIYDNLGKTADRYTAVFVKRREMNIFTVKKWHLPEERFKTANDAIRRAVNLLNPSAKSRAGLTIYLHRQLGSHFAIEYQDVVIRHLIEPAKQGTKHIPTFTEI